MVGLIDFVIGYSLPTIGYGVYLLKASLCAVTNALKIGYRCGKGRRLKLTIITHGIAMFLGISTARSSMNETEVGQWSRCSSIPRDRVYISMTRSRIFLTESDWLKNSFKGGCGIWVRGDTKECPIQPVCRCQPAELGYYDLYLVHSPMAVVMQGS
jgi:diketogulonate reductase-like aldo/keto reductase